MNRKTIPCLVRDEYILGSGGVIGAEGSGGDVALELEFGAMWEGLVKYVTFRNALGEDPETVLVTADLMELRERPPKIAVTPAEAPCPVLPEVRTVYLVPVPAKAKAIAGEMTVTVRGFAVSEDGTETEAALVAATARFRVLPGKWALPQSEGFASPTAAQQLQAEIERIQGDIVEAAKAADAKEAAQQSAAQAAQDAEKAQAARTGAESAKVAAETARGAAEAAKTGAETARSEAEGARTGAETAQSGAQAAQTAAESAADSAEENKEFIRMTGEALGRDMRQFSMSMGNSVRVAQEAADDTREKAAQAGSSAGAAQTWAGKALEQADRAQEKAESSLEQADRAKREADRAQAIAGGDFVTDPELDQALANMGAAPLVGPAELVGELLPGGVLFVTDEALPEDYAVTLEQVLAEGDKAYAGQSDQLETLLTVGVAKALGLRSDGEGSEYTLATLPSLAADIRALCAAAQAGGSYVLDGRTAVSHRQVQYYILHKALVSHSMALAENWSWMGDVRTELQALRLELAQLRALVGDMNMSLDELNGEVV